jgi:hypothetical protein
MTEATLKAKLVLELKDGLPGPKVILRHEEIFRHGNPDMSITWNGHTLWFEAKLATPRLRSKGVQKITCCELEAAGRNCWFVIWFQQNPTSERFTYIVKPTALFRGTWKESYAMKVPGFDHKAFVEFVRNTIEGMNE